MVTFNERDDIRERYGKRPAIQYTKRDDVRELMRSPAGKNYGNMMDLQNQAIRQGGFDKGDSRIAELKKARNQYNRKDKYGIADLLGYSPQEANEIYRQNSGVLREYARPTYKTMYPISDMAHEVTGSGGLTGMLLKGAFSKGKKKGKNFFDDLRQMGADIFGGVGIGGGIKRDEATAEILTNYSDKTFGPNMYDVAGPWFGTAPIEDVEISDLPWQEDKIIEPSDVSSDIIESDLSIDPKPEPNILDPDYLTWDALYGDEYTPEGIPKNEPRIIPGISTPTPLQEENLDVDLQLPYIRPYNDAVREAGIMSQHGQGPMWGETDRRYEKEYRSHIERTGDRMTYDEFERAWERMHALPRGLHFQEPRAGLR